MFDLIISQQDCVDYVGFSQNIDGPRWNIIARQAQELDLAEFLGNALYTDMLGNLQLKEAYPGYDATKEKLYEFLLNGETYQDSTENYLRYDGIKPYLCYMTAKRWVMLEYIRLSATGPIKKKQDEGTEIDKEERNSAANRFESIANGYKAKIRKYLWDKRDQFPQFRHSDNERLESKSGVRINRIDKTDHNLDYWGQGTLLNYNWYL